MEKSKIKLMYLVGSMSDGGAQRILINYLEDLSKDRDIDVKLYVGKSNLNSYYDELLKKNNYNVEYLNIKNTKIKIPILKRIIDSKNAKKKWRNAIKQYKPDIVHVHISEYLLSTLDAITENKVPIRFDTLHSNPLRYKHNKLRIIRRAFQKERFIPICVTEEQVNIAKEYYGFDKYEIVRNGIDIKNIQEKIISRAEARKFYNIPDDAYVIIGVGRLNKIKNFNFLIDAFKMISQKNNKAILIFAGNGPERHKLQKKVKKLKIEDKVNFIGNQDNVVTLYCAADMLGVTSKSESASLVLLEAQICGLNCVISNGVPKESIITNKVQQMKKESTIKDWAEALQNQKFEGQAFCTPEEYEKTEISKKMKDIYMKYWKEYKKNEN